jgi:hypothetical protein
MSKHPNTPHVTEAGPKVIPPRGTRVEAANGRHGTVEGYSRHWGMLVVSFDAETVARMVPCESVRSMRIRTR